MGYSLYAAYLRYSRGYATSPSGMYSRPGLAAIRLRLSSQIRRMSEPSTSSESGRSRRFHFVDTVLKGHASALEDMENEIVEREAMRINDLESNENLLLTRLLPHLQSNVISNAQFVPVGSAVTGLASSHSDLDLVLFPLEKSARDEFIKTIHPNDGLKYEFMSVLRSTIVHAIHNLNDPQFEMEDCHILPLRIPLVICQFTNGTSLDISIPDLTFQSIRNTHMMRQYPRLDVRVGRLLRWLKMWSTSLEIRDSKMGLLSSYHLLLLAIHFLHSDQCLSVPVLPVLYQTHNEIFNKQIPIEDIVSRLEEPPQELDWVSNNTMSTAELVIRFIDYYSQKNILTKSIHIERGMTKDRTNPVAEQAAIYDPYSTWAACRSVNALRAFREAVLFTESRMKNGFMFNPFSPHCDPSFGNFIETSSTSDWRVASTKHKDRMSEMYRGYSIPHSDMFKSESSHDLSPSTLLDESYRQMLMNASFPFSDYEQSGQMNDGTRQFILCDNDGTPWMTMNTESVSSPVCLSLNSPDTISEESINGQQYLNSIKKEEGIAEEQQQIISMSDEQFLQFVTSNQYQIVLPKYDGKVEMGDSFYNGYYALDANGELIFISMNEAANGDGVMKEEQVEVVLVNPKQYYRILKRREARKRLQRRIRPRQKYIHDSRHAHALARNRGEGGKFGAGKRIQ